MPYTSQELERPRHRRRVAIAQAENQYYAPDAGGDIPHVRPARLLASQADSWKQGP